MQAVQITRFGGPEVLEVVELAEPAPVDGELRLAVTGAGVNFADTHQAENSYLHPVTLPFVPGMEVAGITPGGARAVALVAGGGGYAEQAVVSSELCFEIDAAVSDAQALALVLQGVTAWHLLRTCANLRPGASVAVFAAAGGVGSIALQLARLWGASDVIAVASTDDKLALAESLGATAVVRADAPDLAEALRRANGGRRLDVVLEMTGGATFDAALRTLAPMGRLVYYGQASRTIPEPLEPHLLMARGIGVVGFWLNLLTRRPELIRGAFDELQALVAAGTLHPVVGTEWPLGDVRQAHEEMLGRRTTGKVVLRPGSP